MKRKQMIIISIILIMLTSSINMSFAVNTPYNKHQLTAQELEMLSSIKIEEEIYRAQNGITDVIIIPEEIKEQMSAYIINSNGDKVEAEIKATIRKLGSITKDGKRGTMYTLTAVTTGKEKTDSDKITKRGVTAYASLTWIDNFGSKNELVSVSGGWNTGSNSLRDREINYGVTNDSNKQLTRYPSSNSFTYKGTSNMVGLTLGINSFAVIEEYDEIIYLFVHSSIFS